MKHDPTDPRLVSLKRREEKGIPEVVEGVFEMLIWKEDADGENQIWLQNEPTTFQGFIHRRPELD